MTQTVQLKRSATAGAIPSTSDLELGELALNTYDGKAYIKKSVGGTESIVEVGAESSSEITVMKHYLYNASANQTTFSGTDANNESLSYTAGQILVFLNGVFLDPDDYTASNGTSIVLDDGAKSSDYLDYGVFKKIKICKRITPIKYKINRYIKILIATSFTTPLSVICAL